MPVKSRSTHDDDLDLTPDVDTSARGKSKGSKKSSRGKSTKRAAPKKKAATSASAQPRQPEPLNVDDNLSQPDDASAPLPSFVIGGPNIPNAPQPEPSQTITAPVPPISYVPESAPTPTQGEYSLLFMSTPVSSLAHTRLPVDFEKSPKISIGRDAGNIIVIPDQVVSRVHAELTMQDGRIYLHDLGSTNGTFLYDGTDFNQVQDSVEISLNSVFRFGTTTIVKLTRE